MKRIMVVLLFVFGSLIIVANNIFAYTDPGYPHKLTSGCITNPETDQWDFAKNNCTSYCAFMLNEQGLSFINNFDGVHWGNGGNWGDAAESAEIGVDDRPLPGDIAWWEYDWTKDPKNEGDDYGHVAWVEKVYYDSDGNPTHVDITQYNVDPCKFSDKIKVPINQISGFIHILLYKFGVMFYVDSLEMFAGSSWNVPPFSNQTKDEGDRVIHTLYNYRNVTIDGDEAERSVAYFGSSGFGGGDTGTTDSNNEPTQKTNLSLKSVTIKRNGDTTMHEGKNISQPGDVFDIMATIEVTEADCRDSMEEGKDTIEVDVYKRNGKNGNWIKIGRIYISVDKLKKDSEYTGHINYTIEESDRGTDVFIKAIADVENEAKETNENDNESDGEKEWYPIVGSHNMIVANAGLLSGQTTVYQNTLGRIFADIKNIGTDTPTSEKGIRTAVEYIPPGETIWRMMTTEGSDSAEISPNRIQRETTSADQFPFGTVGTWRFRIFVDCYNYLPETNENDNYFEFQVNVVADNRKANVLVTGAGLKQGSRIKKGTYINPYGDFKNTGDACASSAMEVRYKIDDKTRDNDTIEASQLGPGMSKHEEVNNSNIKMGATGERILRVEIALKSTGVVLSYKDFKFTVVK